MEFNLKECKKLLRKEGILNSDGISLCQVNKYEWSQYLYYSRILYSQIRYNSRNEYIFLINQYLDEMIDINKFGLKFSELVFCDLILSI